MSPTVPISDPEGQGEPVEEPEVVTGGEQGAADGEPVAADGDTDATPEQADGRPAWRRVLGRVPIEVYVLTLLAVVTRFAFLYDPRAIVFDEVYFREFSLHYKAGTYYYDIHPPLGKLLLAAWAAIAGVDATALDKTDPAVALRVLPALFGSALILVFYAFVRQLSGSRRIATLGAGLLLLDNAILAISRFTLMDTVLLTFGLGAITVALAARGRSGRSYWLWFTAAAVLAGCAVSIKLTGLASLGLVGVIWLSDVFLERKELKRTWKPRVGQAALLALIPLVIYFASFAVHFALLPKSGPGDAYMSVEFQSTLKGNANFKPDAHLSLTKKFTEINEATHRYELSLNTQTHPYMSKWWSWPFMKRGVYYYVSHSEDQKTGHVYLLGNPFVWWGILLGALVTIIGWIARPKRFAPYKWSLIFLAFAWFANYLPFTLIERPMFLYHYFFALLFSLAFVMVGLGALTGWSKDQPKPFSFANHKEAAGYWGLLAGALLLFLFFAPITYGLPLSTDGLDARMWFTSWR